MRCRPAITPAAIALAAPLAAALAAALAACAPIGPRPPDPVDGVYTEFAPHYPFVPVRVDIHPATRLGRDATGEPYIRVYLQFRDRWNDNIKTIGSFQMLLYADETEEKAWGIVNLSDDRTNHEHYDPVTGMYAMNLYDLPSWLGALAPLPARDAEAPVPEDAPGPVSLRVRFVFPGPDGPEELTDDYYLRP